MRRFVVLTLVIAASACGRQVQVGSSAGGPASSRDPAITDAAQLVAAMHQRYTGKWYRNLTFIQKSSYLRPDGTVSRVETWYEAGMIPGRLRIDLGDPSRRNGALYRNDSVYSVQAGRIADRRKGRNLLMTLGFDVYGQPPARTLAQLREERVDLSVLRTDRLNGKVVYVVGAGPTDSTSNQFWVEAERLLFVRLIQSDSARRRTQDIRFEKYVPHAGGWVAEEVRILVGGKMIFHEEYSNVRVNVALDDNLFIPEKWATATHWFKK
jgi:hypothetical protein